jgi:hypothetical protein
MKKTDNSYFKEKLNLRMESLPDKESIYILDCFSGTGSLWKEVQKNTKKTLKVLPIEIEKGKNKKALSGNNLKYLKILDLNKFDIIDLDSYGIPYEQLDIIFSKNYKGIVHVTAIQSGMGQLPHGLLISIGYTYDMIKKIKSIFNVNGLKKLENYLYLNGIRSITGYFIDRKSYFYFNIN